MPRLRFTVFFLVYLFVIFSAGNCRADYTWKDISIPLRKNIKVEGSVTINFEMPPEILRKHKKIRLDITTWDLDREETAFIQLGDSWFSGYYSISGEDGKRVADFIEIDIDDLKPGMNKLRIGNRVAKYRYWFWIKELKFDIDFKSIAQTRKKDTPGNENRGFSLDDINEIFIAAHKTYTKKYPENDAPDSTSVQSGEQLLAIGRVHGTNWYLVRKDGKKAGYIHFAQLLPYEPEHISKDDTKILLPQPPSDTMPDKQASPKATAVATKAESISAPKPSAPVKTEAEKVNAPAIVAKQHPSTRAAINVASGSRVALVIGNSEYKSARLSNPVNDSDDMTSVLHKLGFEVIKSNNANRREMLTALNSFSRKLRRAEIGFFYFAGHGMQINGRNFLIPLKTSISTPADVEYEAVNAGRIIKKMAEAGTRLNIVVLDACRNNPFRSLFRSNISGLARMDVPVGTIIAYATSPGDVAADGLGRNGIYTKHLLESLSIPGLNVQEVFNQAGLGVMQETGMRQVPWFNSSPMNPVYLAGEKE